MAVALILVLVAVGSVLFHFLSPWWFTPIASNWNYIDATVNITFWITGFVFSAIVLFMAYCVFRFRHSEGRKAAFDPETKWLESWLGVGTAAGVTAMLAPGLFVWYQFVTVPAGAAAVRGCRPAMAVELSDCQARTAGWAHRIRNTSRPTILLGWTRTIRADKTML